MTTALALLTVLALSAAEADGQPGAQLILRLETTVSTRTAVAGNPVQLRTAHPIVINGRAIPAGSAARGVVLRLLRPGRVRGRAEIDIEVTSITAPDGSLVPLTARWFSSLSAQPRTLRIPQAPRLPVWAGMAAGYGTAGLVSKVSNSSETIVHTGLVAGLATGVLVGVLKRGDHLVLPRGRTIDVLIPQP